MVRMVHMNTFERTDLEHMEPKSGTSKKKQSDFLEAWQCPKFWKHIFPAEKKPLWDGTKTLKTANSSWIYSGQFLDHPEPIPMPNKLILNWIWRLKLWRLPLRPPNQVSGHLSVIALPWDSHSRHKMDVHPSSAIDYYPASHDFFRWAGIPSL